jgi:predicted phosphodiesterase
MRLALLADVHANLEALEAVLDAVARAEVDRVVCLGDLVGYNAHPVECIGRVRAAATVVVAGNHDRDTVAEEPALGTSPDAREAQRWTRRCLGPDEISYLRGLPNRHVEPGAFVAVHGCYLNDKHVSGYVTSTMLERNLEAVAARADWPKLALCGHTHAPLAGWLEGDRLVETRLSEPAAWPAEARVVLVNPGSVGQPRDGDPRASYGVVDLEARRVVVERVDYDVDKAARAVVSAGLPEVFARRLLEGR